mmetsp:Transcript_18180/g.56795  ORF Transcript_18180/g.56795 Transcript_18180/m.56795 type:complete len:122 (-) Transcript_18180:205-570(-)
MTNLVNHSKIRIQNTHGTRVSLSNVRTGMRVRRGFHWNPKSWRDDIDTDDTNNPKRRLSGTVVGYVNKKCQLVGENSMQTSRFDRITNENGSGWAVVEWDNTKRSVYPIGAEGLYTLYISI